MLGIMGAVAVLAFTACGAEKTDMDVEVQDEEIKDEIVQNKEIVQLSAEIDEKNEYTKVDSYDALQKFSYDFFANNIDTENPVFSPLSAYVAMSMTGCGANANTKTEFENVLGSEMMDISSDLMHSYYSDGELFKLYLANSVWIDDEFEVRNEWIMDVASDLKCDVYQTDISTVEAMEGMNNWIEEKTNGMIKDMLREPLEEASKLALFNSVYFKSKWQSPFEAGDTFGGEFTCADNTVVNTKMMHKSEEELDYIKNDFCDGIMLPYKGEDSGLNLAYIALKPTSDSNIRDILPKMTKQVMTDLIKNNQTKLVNLTLPKYTIECDKQLNDSLIDMGISDAFDSKKADFSNMGTAAINENLFISLVKQRTKIIVDEEGTEAAAVTETIMALGCALREEDPIEVKFDKPFMYLIMDTDRNIPLFMGIYDRPQE